MGPFSKMFKILSVRHQKFLWKINLLFREKSSEIGTGFKALAAPPHTLSRTKERYLSMQKWYYHPRSVSIQNKAQVWMKRQRFTEDDNSCLSSIAIAWLSMQVIVINLLTSCASTLKGGKVKKARQKEVEEKQSLQWTTLYDKAAIPNLKAHF